jgi:trehalose/maltose hydrolase-like predicted phosphorylase
MFIAFDSKTLLFEQFSGYFKKEPIDLRSYEARSAVIDMILDHERIQKINVVKQADVLMATYLRWEELPPDVRVANSATTSRGPDTTVRSAHPFMLCWPRVSGT